MIRILLLSATLLCSCTTTAGRGLTPVWQQRVYSLAHSGQPCLSDDRTLALADLALVQLVSSASLAGLGSYEDLAAKVGRPGVCLVEKPALCGSIKASGCTILSGSWFTLDRSLIVHELGHQVAASLGLEWPQTHDGPWLLIQRRAENAFRAAELLLR